MCGRPFTDFTDKGIAGETNSVWSQEINEIVKTLNNAVTA